jgi:hypothetical protein
MDIAIDGTADLTFEPLAEAAVPLAPQDATTHALVQNPFAWGEE